MGCLFLKKNILFICLNFTPIAPSGGTTYHMWRSLVVWPRHCIGEAWRVDRVITYECVSLTNSHLVFVTRIAGCVYLFVWALAVGPHIKLVRDGLQGVSPMRPSPNMPCEFLRRTAWRLVYLTRAWRRNLIPLASSSVLKSPGGWTSYYMLEHCANIGPLQRAPYAALRVFDSLQMMTLCTLAAEPVSSPIFRSGHPCFIDG